jgi:chromosome segregation ATPase
VEGLSEELEVLRTALEATQTSLDRSHDALKQVQAELVTAEAELKALNKELHIELNTNMQSMQHVLAQCDGLEKWASKREINICILRYALADTEMELKALRQQKAALDCWNKAMQKRIWRQPDVRKQAVDHAIRKAGAVQTEACLKGKGVIKNKV